MLEKEIEKTVCDYATKQKIINYKFTSPCNKGVPDRIFITPNGVIFFIEFKTKYKKLTKLQQWTHDIIQKYHVNTFMVNNVLKGIEIINQMLDINKVIDDKNI